MKENGPPPIPRPSQPSGEGNNDHRRKKMDRRGQFAMRSRTISDGSTRGAFSGGRRDKSGENTLKTGGEGADDNQDYGSGVPVDQVMMPSSKKGKKKTTASQPYDEEYGASGYNGEPSPPTFRDAPISSSDQPNLVHPTPTMYHPNGRAEGPWSNDPTAMQRMTSEQTNNTSLAYSSQSTLDQVSPSRRSLMPSQYSQGTYKRNPMAYGDPNANSMGSEMMYNMNPHEREMYQFSSMVQDSYVKEQGGLPNSNTMTSTDTPKARGFSPGAEHDAQSSSRGTDDESDYSHYKDTGLLTRFIRYFFYDKEVREFTSLQQNSWAIIIGIVMGVFTACWGMFVEYGIDIMWRDIPERLMAWGLFTDLDGRFPLPHYMWVCQAIWGGILAYITAVSKPAVPGQNEWIDDLHRVGLMDHSMFFYVVGISTFGMISGLSVGPEMPLVLSSGMVGSYLGLRAKQSILSSRVMNLTSASAGIAGFFGFPMAGALFVLELPHRMGLQYFEAITPATVASIVSVIVNRMVTKNELKGQFNYPFLATSLPSHFFYVSILYGFIGSFVGICYADGVLFLKKNVHDWFHAPHDDHQHYEEEETSQPHEVDAYSSEVSPLVGGSAKDISIKKPKKKQSCCQCIGSCFTKMCTIPHEPTRATVAGVLAGGIVGVICMYLPHQLFWGEAQLQTLIDRGRTPLPVFEYDEDEPLSIMTAYGYCMVDPEGSEEGEFEGFNTACAGAISALKILVIGLSLGTGICGGHFWGPLYTACAASHFFTDVLQMISVQVGFGHVFSSFPAVAVLCIMGSAHIVTFRAHLAIMLILTLSIGSFVSEDSNVVAGDYSAIFPLLVIACFIPLSTTRKTVFYKTQRCRGDIDAVQTVLEEPKIGFWDSDVSESSSFDTRSSGSESGESDESETGLSIAEEDEDLKKEDEVQYRPAEMEEEQEKVKQATEEFSDSPAEKSQKSVDVDPLDDSQHSRSQLSVRSDRNRDESKRSLERLHRRTRSSGTPSMDNSQHSAASGSLSRPRRLERSDSGRSFGRIDEFKPTLLDQGRANAMSRATTRSRSRTPVNRSPGTTTPVNNMPPKGHRRKSSGTSLPSSSEKR